MFSNMINLLKAFLFLSFLLLTQLSYSQPAAVVSSIDARDWPIDKTPFAIVGHCHFFEGQLLNPEECKKTKGEILNFPELWKAKNSDAGLGSATYSLSVLLPHDHKMKMALALPQMYSSYQL